MSGSSKLILTLSFKPAQNGGYRAATADLRWSRSVIGPSAGAAPITRWSISVLPDRRLCSVQPFRRFPRVHVMLSILRGPGGGAAGVWGDNLDDMTRPAGLTGTHRRSGGQRRQALGGRRQVPPRCMSSSTAAAAIRMIFPPGMPPTITVWITTGAVSPVRPGSGGGRVAKAAGAAAPNARIRPAQSRRRRSG